MAITFDDGFVSNLQAAAPAMREFGCRAINYLVADRIGQASDWEAAEGGEARPLIDDAQIREWISAGNWIGAHTCTHPRLSRIPRDRAREEIVSGKKKLEDRVIPENFDYSKVVGLKTEARQKLSQIRPRTFGQAARISGVNPSDISALAVWASR